MATDTEMLDNRELATVLAALRFWQRELVACEKVGVAVPIGSYGDLATDCGTLEPLNVDEIDALVDRLNAPA